MAELVKKLQDVFASFLQKYLPGTTLQSSALVKNLNAEMLNGMTFMDYSNKIVYGSGVGVLIKIDSKRGVNNMCFLTVKINGYWQFPSDLKLQFYNSINNENPKIIASSGFDSGGQISEVKIFYKDDYVHVFIPFNGNFTTFYGYALINNGNISSSKNQILSMEHVSSDPTEGIESVVTCTIKKVLFQS